MSDEFMRSHAAALYAGVQIELNAESERTLFSWLVSTKKFSIGIGSDKKEFLQREKASAALAAWREAQTLFGAKSTAALALQAIASNAQAVVDAVPINTTDDGNDHLRFIGVLRNLSRRIGFGTHTNRSAEARNTLWLSFLPTTTSLACGEYIFPEDVLDGSGGGAHNMPFSKILLGPVLLDGKLTCLADAVLQQRAAGQWLLAQGYIDAPCPEKISSPGVFDKELLLPLPLAPGQTQAYCAVFPVTAASQPLVLAAAATRLRALLETGYPPLWQGVAFTKKTHIFSSGRIDSLSHPENYSYRIGALFGNIYRPLLVVHRFRAKTDFTLVGIARMLPAMHTVLAGQRAGLRISRRSAMNIAKEDNPTIPVYNAAHTETIYNVGVTLGAIIRATLFEALGFYAEMLTPDANIHDITQHRSTLSLLAAMQHRNYGQIGYLVRDMFSVAQLTPFGLLSSQAQFCPDGIAPLVRDHSVFDSGIVSGMRFGIDAAVVPVIAPNPVAPMKTKLTTSSGPASISALPASTDIVIQFMADDVDLGSQSAFIGLPALTAIQGYLHNLLSRSKDPVVVEKFKPVFHHIDLGIHATRLVHNFRPAGYVTEDSAGKKSKPLLEEKFSVFEDTTQGHPASSGCAAWTGMSDLKKILNPPIVPMIRGTVDMSLVVQLRDPPTLTQLACIAERLAHLKFAGGSVRLNAKVTSGIQTKLGWTLAKESEVDEQFISECFLNGAMQACVTANAQGQDATTFEYRGFGPLALVHTGYQFLHDSPVAGSRSGSGYWGQAVYHGVRLIASKQDQPEAYWGVEYQAGKQYCLR